MSLHTLELVAELSRCGELDAVARGRERLDARTGLERRAREPSFGGGAAEGERRLRRRGHRQLDDAGRNVGLREARGEHLRHALLGLAGRLSQELLVVVVGEVLAEQHQRRQVNVSAIERIEHDGKALYQPGDRRSTERLAVTHPQAKPAEVVVRRARRLEMQLSSVDLRETCNHPRDPAALFAEGRLRPRAILGSRAPPGSSWVASTTEDFVSRIRAQTRERIDGGFVEALPRDRPREGRRGGVVTSSKGESATIPDVLRNPVHRNQHRR